MAADRKAVESTAADQEEHSTRVAKEDRLTATESHSEKESHLVTDHVEVSVRVARGHAEASVKTISAVRESHSATDRAEISVRTAKDHAEASVKAEREDHSAVRREVSVKVVKEDHSMVKERVSAARESHSATDHAEASVKAEREEHSMAKERASAVTESHSAEREEASEQRRASTRRISTISAMRTKAESTR